MSETNITQNPTNTVVLPCSPDQFKDFISSLLGKPQTITGQFSEGHFDIDHNEIENFYHLITQRVLQQNEGSLIQFIVQIFYDDHSSVTLNSFAEFKTYNEVKPLISIGVQLTWIFLIKFQDKKYPEKQSIEVRINSRTTFIKKIFESFILEDSESSARGFIAFRIQHTARTWGADIESLLTGHIQSLLKHEGSFRKFIRTHSEWLGSATASGVVGASLIVAHYTTKDFAQKILLAAKNAFDGKEENIDLISRKLDFLINTDAGGVWQNHGLLNITLAILTVLFSIFSLVFVETLASYRHPSFLVLTRKAKDAKEKSLTKTHNKWIAFLFAPIWTIALSVAANFLFAYFFQGWHP